jgi:sirohydrochlorin ferrochelatase
VDRVQWLRPDLDVRLAFLDLCAPGLDAVLTTVSRAVVVPLLLGRAFHADVDVPGAVSRAVTARPKLDVRVADVLGPDDAVPNSSSAATTPQAHRTHRSHDPRR